MSTTANTAARSFVRPLPAGLVQLLDDAAVVASVLFHPRRVMAEVEQMAALHRRAASIEASDPVAAERLRTQASRIGLR